MDEIMSVFNAYKKRVFNGIRTEVEAALEDSYKNEYDNWMALSDKDRAEWDLEGGYGAFWYEWIDAPYDGAYEYINELWDRYWSNDEVLNQTLEAGVGLDPKTIHDEVEKLLFDIMRKIAGLPAQNNIDKDSLLNFINWPVDNPKELI
jgi:hypothetical protein